MARKKLKKSRSLARQKHGRVMGSLMVLVHGMAPTREDFACLEAKKARLEEENARLEEESSRLESEHEQLRDTKNKMPGHGETELTQELADGMRCEAAALLKSTDVESPNFDMAKTEALFRRKALKASRKMFERLIRSKS